jgi:two-component system, OmpR family, phosphate regulon sensor histidine kinase PhoR
MVPDGMDRLFDRFPQAVVALDRDLRVVAMNERAHFLAEYGVIRTGEPLNGELRSLAARLIAHPEPLAPTALVLAGRSLRIGGIPADDRDAAFLLIEDVTAELRQDRVMREFVRNAAHELRTPLTGIAVAVEVLQSGAKNDPVERDRFLAHVERHTNRLARIAHSLLVLARAQSGEELRVELVELTPLLDRLVREAVPSPNVAVTASCPASLAVPAEPDLLHEALSALVDNAVSHTTEGFVKLDASESDGRVSIAVADTGGGVLPEHRARILEPFYRVGDTGEGFGLGLAIAAQAVEAMHGELLVGEVADGARFTIRLPVG